MANEPDIPVGHDEPLKPTHSLPRYSEPTPETHRKVSREEEAELALKNTSYGTGARIALILIFLLTIVSVPAIQIAAEIRNPAAADKVRTFDLYKAYPAWEKIKAVRSATDLWRLLPRAAELKSAEKELETQSVVSEWLLPRVQSVLSEKLGAGNEQVYLGRDGWLFYRPDVDYVTGPAFLNSSVASHRAHAGGVQTDPIKAIVEFRDQLASRGIDLVVMPIPMKPGVESGKLASRRISNAILQNPSFAEFKARLERDRVRFFDPGEAIAELKASHSAESTYLETDTHWRPETMEFVAGKLAGFLGSNAAPLADGQQITGTGDIARMLKLRESQKVFRAETVTIHPVSNGGSAWRPSKDADVLLLGDSFSNIFSLGGLGWGESAGFAEQFSRAMSRPLDCILRNSDGAFATREILSHELARGNDRLAGKKLVIWEFAARELAFGDWKTLEMKVGTAKPSKFFVPKPGESIVAEGTVQSISSIPRPGSVPYRDHIAALHVVDLSIKGRNDSENLESVVYVESMHDNVLTRAARLGPGDHVTLQLRPWAVVADRYEKINRSEIDDPSIQLEEPCWGELGE